MLWGSIDKYTMGKLLRMRVLSQALATVHATGHAPVALHVAFNPYLEDSAEAAEERKRLKLKLQTGMVAGVYLQTGSALDRLEDGLKFLLNTIQQESKARNIGGKVELLGSVFLPTKR